MKALPIVAAVLLLGFFPYAALVGGLRLVTSAWPKSHSLLVAEIVPALLALAALFLVEGRHRSESWRDVLRGLGLSRPVARPLIAGGIAGLPAVLALVIVLSLPGVDRAPAEALPFLALRILLAQVFFEELLFRGVALKRLEAVLSPKRAATGAALAFGLCHFGNLFFRAFSVERLVEIGVQVVLTGLLAVAPILLVRRSGGLLWGAFVWHLLLDLSILFPNAMNSSTAIIVGLAGGLLTLPAAWAAGRLVLREPRNRSAKGSRPSSRSAGFDTSSTSRAAACPGDGHNDSTRRDERSHCSRTMTPLVSRPLQKRS